MKKQHTAGSPATTARNTANTVAAPRPSDEQPLNVTFKLDQRMFGPETEPFLQEMAEEWDCSPENAVVHILDKVAREAGGLNPHGSQMLMKWVGPPINERETMDRPQNVLGMWQKFIAARDWFDHSKESVVIIAVNVRLHFMGWHLISTGGATQCQCCPREVLRAALAFDAWGIVLVHNHPSGVVLPSRQDGFFTKKIADACRVVGVSLFDHVIVDSHGTDYYSFRETLGFDFAEVVGTMDSKTVPAPPVTAPVRADGPHALRGAATSVKVTIRLPRVILWHHFLPTFKVALSSAVQNVHSVEWERRWNVGKSLKRHLKRQKAFKKFIDEEFVLPMADFESLEIAATGIRERPETLLAAIAGEVAAKLRISEDAAERAREIPTTKILQFIR